MTENPKISSYKDLVVWQKSIELARIVYELTENFPHQEMYGLTSQMRRASVSVASNIAEGRNRKTKNDFIQFLRIALGSLAELETQVEIAKQLTMTKSLNYSQIILLCGEIGKMLNGMIKKLAI